MKKISAKKPRIGILLDHEKSGSFSAAPYYALREHYFAAVSKAGGIPYGLGYAGLADYLGDIDALIVPGGNFKTPGAWYVEGEKSPYKPSKILNAEIKMITEAEKMGLPMLLTCAAHQVRAGMGGGLLTGDLTKHFNTAVDHKGIPPSQAAHGITIVEGSLLHECIGATYIEVNSHHQEAVVEPPQGFRVSAYSSDGVIEAIEPEDHKNFMLCVQWHPELRLSKNDPSQQIYTHLIAEALRF